MNIPKFWGARYGINIAEIETFAFSTAIIFAAKCMMRQGDRWIG